MSPDLTTLVVGGGGFIGSYLTKLLVGSGRKVIVVGRSSSTRFSLPADVRYVQGDAGDAKFMGDIVSQCHEIVDLAYATVPKTSFDAPVHDITANLPATVNLLQLASECALRCFLLVSSGGTVYGNPAYLPIDETHPTNPVSPYGITKLAAEKYGLLFNHSRGLPIVIARPANPYGPNQLGNMGQGFIAAAILSVLSKENVKIYGERGTIRDYIYIQDLAEGLMAALEFGKVGEIYNIGTGIGNDNRNILDSLEAILRGSHYALNVDVAPGRDFDVKANVLSSAKLTYLSGWRASTEIEAGLVKTWEWALRFMVRQ